MRVIELPPSGFLTSTTPFWTVSKTVTARAFLIMGLAFRYVTGGAGSARIPQLLYTRLPNNNAKVVWEAPYAVNPSNNVWFNYTRDGNQLTINVARIGGMARILVEEGGVIYFTATNGDPTDVVEQATLTLEEIES